MSRSVLVVEDDALLRELIASVLEGRGFIAETAATAADAKRTFRRMDPDAVVIDIELGPGPTGFDLADALRDQVPHLPIVFLTNLPDSRFADREPRSLPPGIAYLRKGELTDIAMLVGVLDSAMRGATGGLTRHDRDPQRPLAQLTQKQVEVLRMIAEGLTNAEIARRRGISVKAVEDTVGRICVALGLDAAADLNLRVAAARAYFAGTQGIPQR